MMYVVLFLGTAKMYWGSVDCTVARLFYLTVCTGHDVFHAKCYEVITLSGRFNVFHVKKSRHWN